jgi:hypothetical protein
VGNSNQWLKRPLDENLRLYDAEICYMDEQLGLLLDGLKERDRFDDALVVIAADHGESFDAGKGPHHGDTLDEALIHVPLFVKHPKQTQGARVEELFETRRLFFTMRDATADPSAKTPAPQDESHAQAFAVSELWRGKPDDLNPVLRALIRWPLKLLKPPGDGTEPSKLFDLSASGEARETADLSKDKSSEREALEAMLSSWVAERKNAAGAPVQLDPDMVEKLRALGYME